jgi:monoterpene epsilon-lactone hydrolase
MSSDSDATLRAAALELPPSEHWSAEFKAWYTGFLAARAARAQLKVPAHDALKAEWDRFDAESDRPLRELLSRARERYAVEVEESTLAGVPVAIVTPQGGIAPENAHRVLINLHGGGFVFSRGLTVGQLESIPVAALGRIQVITLDYRQAPFHFYPAASEDVEAVYREVLKKTASEAIGIYGCSAGAVLTAQSLARFQSRGLARPGAAGMLSFAPTIAPWPWGIQGDSRLWLWGNEMKSELAQADHTFMQPLCWYMEAADANDPHAYPGAFDEVLASFPPVLLLTGTREYWFSAVIAAHARFLKLGVDSSLYVMEGAPHGAHMAAVDTPEARDANAWIARWFDRQLDR